MAKGERAFWSSLPGVLTGLAGTLTAAVALLGLSLSQGWIGDGDGEDPVDAGSEVVRISVEPEAIELTKVPGRAAVETATVTNDGTRPVTVTTEVTGADAATFGVQDGDCTRSEVPPGGTCDVEVSFDAGVGTYEARLIVSADDDQQVQEVELMGRSGDLLG